MRPLERTPSPKMTPWTICSLFTPDIPNFSIALTFFIAAPIAKYLRCSVSKEIADHMTAEEQAQFRKLLNPELAIEDANTANVKQWPTLDTTALYGLAGEIIRAIEPHTEADSAGLLTQLLTFFGSAAGRSAYYRVESDHHHTNLFTVLVGPTSKGRKGTSKGQITALFQSADEIWT